MHLHRWCEYQNRLKCARLRFSIANQIMTPRTTVISHPVIPCSRMKSIIKPCGTTSKERWTYGSGGKVGLQEAYEASLGYWRETVEVAHVSECVYSREEKNAPSYRFVECDAVPIVSIQPFLKARYKQPCMAKSRTHLASNGIRLFSCVRRMRVRKFLQTGSRRIATWTCKTRAQARAIAKVQPNVSLAVLRLSAVGKEGSESHQKNPAW